MPVFAGAGSGDLICRCGNSILIAGYAPQNVLAIRIRCFRCGAVTTTPGLPAGEILPGDAAAVVKTEVPMLSPRVLPAGSVLFAQGAATRAYALTRPRDPPAEPMLVSPATLESAAADYDRLTGGALQAHIAATPSAMEPWHGDYPFAWSLLRLREQVGKPDWSWLYQNDDAMAAMHIASMHHFMACWGEHPLLDRLALPLAAPGQFLRTMGTFAVAKLLYDAGNRVGFTVPATGEIELRCHFTTAAGEPLSLALQSPDALQWRERERWNPTVLATVVTQALAAAHGQVNSRRPGIVILTASILQPGFDQALVDCIHAVFRSISRRHRGVAAVAVVVPKVFPVAQLDRVGFGYGFYPLRNPGFAGENPIRIGSAADFS